MRTADILLLLLLIEASTIQNAVGQYEDMTIDDSLFDLPFDFQDGFGEDEDITTDSTLYELPFEFLCSTEGNFSIPDSCTDFYQCQDSTGQSLFSVPTIVTCPLGTVFDGYMEECVVPALVVTNRPECAGEDIMFPPTDNCTQDLVEEMAEAAFDTCLIMNNISEYARLVVSSLPFRPSLSYHEEFNKIIPDFNEILAKSQENVKVWRRGNDIFGNIKVNYMMAKQYGSEFKRKYMVHQKRRNSQSVLEEDKDAERIIELQNDINILEEDIENAKVILNKTSVSDIKAFFENSIKERIQMIEKKQQQIETTSAIGRELEELTDFLEFVRNDANAVEQKAETLRKRLEQFYSDLQSDLASFANFSILVNTSITTVQKNRDKMRLSVTGGHDQVGILETKLEEDDAMIAYLNDASENVEKDIIDQIKVIERKQKEFLEQKDTICPPGNMLLSLFSFRYSNNRKVNDCDNLQSNFNATLRGDLDYLEALNDEFERLNQERIKVLSQMGLSDEDSVQTHVLHEHKDWKSPLETELKMFEELDHELQTLCVETNSSLILISEVVEKLQKVKFIFHEIKGNLDEMIVQINSSQNDEERQNAKVVVDSDLFTLKCQVEPFSEEITEFDKCI